MSHPRALARMAAIATACLLVLAVLTPTFLTALQRSTAPAGPAGTPHWVGTWAQADALPHAGRVGSRGLIDMTLRQQVHISVGGPAIRVRLSNVFGTQPLEVGTVTVARQRGNARAGIDTSSLQTVTFDGRDHVTVPVGERVFSDRVTLHVPAGSDLITSIYLPGPTGRLTSHLETHSTVYAAPGDATGHAAGDAFHPIGTTGYVLDGVDAWSGAAGAVVFFGDSITNGTHSTVDANLRYPDQVADRLLRRPEMRQAGVLNLGIGGNAWFGDRGPRGQSGLHRFDRDVLAQTDVRTVVVLEGINDIGIGRGNRPLSQFVAAYEDFISWAHDAGIRVVGATLLPYEGSFYFSPAGERRRQQVNRWIRTSGEFDAVVDLDRALRDPNHPAALRAAYDSGDHLHPNDKGYAAIAAAFDLSALAP
ncbi:MAG: SGNH/GDSL hydrolase family protein [Nocardioidaceae bacterium]